MRKSLRLLRFYLALAVAACLAGPADAVTITLYDFEGNDGLNSPVLSEGSFYVDEGSFGVGPYQGSYQGVLQTIGGVGTGTIESNLGLGNRRIRRIFRQYVRSAGYSSSRPNQVERGSAFQITFDAEAGDVLQFDWNMLSNELYPGPPADPDDYDPNVYTDFAYFRLTGADTAEGTLANVNDGSFSALGATDYDFETGQQTTELTLDSGGSYTFTIGIHDVADNDNNFASALVFDYFRLLRTPEPGTFGSVAGGLVAFAWLSRRRRGRC